MDVQLTNFGNISLPLAVWLAADDYDVKPQAKTVSATSLLKPIKSLVLTQQMIEKGLGGQMDVLDLLAARMGTALHDAAERAWLNKEAREAALTVLGIPKHVHHMVYVNPETPPDDPDAIVVYIERRSKRVVRGWTVTGKFDFVFMGRLRDIKSTKVYAWISGSNDVKYALQGSIYRWLNQDLITDDTMEIDFILKDWQAMTAQRDKKYPAFPIMSRSLPLLPVAEIERRVTNKIIQLEENLPRKEEDIPPCTPEELWQEPTKWAYYRDPTKLARATKIFENEYEANSRYIKDGSVGLVQRRPGKVKYCAYCPARAICKQAERYVAQGLLEY